MFELVRGNIFESDAEALVNTVNCVGVMGRGIAFQFKKIFPENFKAYEAACKRGALRPGQMFVFETGRLTNPKFIINFPTKRHWRGNSRLEDIDTGLVELVNVIRNNGIRTIAIPPLGCGLGGLNWNEVRSRIERALAPLSDLNVLLFEPNGTPPINDLTRDKVPPTMTLGRAALIELMHRYLCGLLDPFVSLLEVHKLMYFMQEAGEALRLRFVKAPFGPYAENLRHVFNQIEGHFITGYNDGGDAPTKAIHLVSGAEKEAKKVLSQSKESMARFDRVAKLVEGYESPFGLELLATVHWLLQHERVSSDELIDQVYAWNSHKKQFTPQQIRLAENHLKTHDWITAH